LIAAASRVRPRALLSLSFAFGLASGPAFADPSFIGIWYSAFQPDEPGVLSLIEFKDDGTFYEEFRKCVNGEFVGYQFESGTLTLMDNIERIVVDMINGDAAKVEDTYAVEYLSDTERRIRMDDHVFVSHRVAKFDFPNCPTGT